MDPWLPPLKRKLKAALWWGTVAPVATGLYGPRSVWRQLWAPWLAGWSWDFMSLRFGVKIVLLTWAVLGFGPQVLCGAQETTGLQDATGGWGDVPAGSGCYDRAPSKRAVSGSSQTVCPEY